MEEERIYPKSAEHIQIVEQYAAGKQMLKRIGPKVSTIILYSRGVLMFADFLHKNLDEIVDEYKRDANTNLFKTHEKWEEIFADYAAELQQKYKGSTPATYFAGAVALINTNVPKSSRIKPEFPKARSRVIPPITIEDLRKVRSVCNETQRAFIDLLKDSGMSRDDIIELNYGDVKKAVEDETVKFFKVRVYRKKEDVEYETWIGPNAIESLRVYFEYRRRRGETITDTTPIFASHLTPYERINKETLSAILRRLSERTGITISTHRLRKFFETYIVGGGVHPITAKYWMGHKITTSRDIESRYIIPPENLQREQYEKAYSHIDVEGRMSIQELQERQRLVEDLQDKILRGEALTAEELALAKRYNIRFAVRHAEFVKQRTKDDCQKIVTEDELEGYLANGWHVEAVLPSGKIVISNEG